MKNRIAVALIGLAAWSTPLVAKEMSVTVTDADGAPVPLVMVTAQPAAPELFKGKFMPERSVFTGQAGTAQVTVPDKGAVSLRLRKPGYTDN